MGANGRIVASEWTFWAERIDGSEWIHSVRGGVRGRQPPLGPIQNRAANWLYGSQLALRVDGPFGECGRHLQPVKPIANRKANCNLFI